MGLDFLTIDQYFSELFRKKKELEERIHNLEDELFFDGQPRHNFPRSSQTRISAAASLRNILSRKLPPWQRELEVVRRQWEKLSAKQKTEQEKTFRKQLDTLLNKFRNLTADVDCQVPYLKNKKS